MCLGSGALLDFAVAPYEGKETGEQALLRRLLFQLRAGDILLGDANFENYFLLAMVLLAGADVVFEKNGSRIIDFKMDMLRCKSPDMVRKEISVNLLVYNVIRALMGKASRHIGKTPREISFKAAQETLVSFHQTLLGASGDWLEEKVTNMLKIIGQHIVGNRPGRSEPRAVKRRPKPHKRLQHPRAQARRLKQYQGKAA